MEHPVAWAPTLAVNRGHERVLSCYTATIATSHQSMGKTKVPALGSPVETLTRRMFTRIIASVARSLREHDLSVAQLAALYMLDDRKALRVTEVSTELSLSLPTTSRLVDDLVRQGLVARDEDPNDRRARILTLTAKGRGFIEKSSEARVATFASAAAEIPATTTKALLSLGKSQ